MSQLVGHQAVLNRFSSALAADSLHHAWLLYGLKGIGKRTLAEKLAGQLLCVHNNACGACHGCRMLQAGSHPDLFRLGLIDGKRDLNIEQVRSALSFLALSAAEGGRRVVILDDAERMNNQAANALLKGLEEPSAGSVLLMVCSDLERLPATVRSRCMLAQCTPLSDADVRRVLQQQEAPIDASHVELAVRLASGSPGAVSCMQDVATARALQAWQELISDIGTADIGRVEQWIRMHIKTVPHQLVIQIIADSAYPRLLQSTTDSNFLQQQSLQQAWQQCLRWPGDVVRHSLRAGPALLAALLQLRAALKAV